MKKTNFKKALSMVLAMMLALSTLVMIPLTASAEGGTNIPGVSGLGTEDAPYLIGNASDLEKLIIAAKNEDGNGIAAGTVTYVNFTANVVLPEATADQYTFVKNAYGSENPAQISWRIDGGDYTISGMKQPLFGSFAKTEAGIEVKNLKLEGDIVADAARYVGALVGGVYGNVTIDNCHFDGSIKTTYGKDVNVVGGLVGLVSKFNFTIKNSTNSGSVLNDVATDGDGDGKAEAYAGGIVGQLSHYTDAGEIIQIVENCTNSGSVTVNNAVTLEAAVVGGVVGGVTPNTVRNNIQYSATIKDCSNSGALASNQTKAIIGGVIGYTYVQNSVHGVSSYARTDVIDCTTTGNYAPYTKEGIMEIHTYAGENPCECTDEGCFYTKHTFDNSWDVTCADCDYTRPIYTVDGASDAWLSANAGTEDDPFVIETAEDFAGLSAMSYDADAREALDGAYFVLGDNIDLSDYAVSPINADGATIVFDGNGKTISNWTLPTTEYSGVFAHVGAGSTIKNLTLDNVDFVATKVGALVVAEAKAGLVLENVATTANCSLSAEKASVAGGLVGTIIDDEATADEENNVKIIFCVNNADVAAKHVAGGIVGKIQGIFKYEISYCINKGEISATSIRNDALYASGIVAYITAPEVVEEDAEAYVEAYIKSCYNVGALSTVDTTASCYVGGMAGYMSSIVGADAAISNCYDYSARKVSTKSEGNKLANAGLVGSADKNLTKFVDFSYAANAAETTSAYMAIVAWNLNDTSSQIDGRSAFVESATAAIVNGNGASSTIEAEMARIDNAVATKTELVWNFVGDEGGDDAGDEAETTVPETTPAPETTAPAPETTAPAAEKKGCRGAMDSTYAVLALVAVLGFAFVAKKREEN